MREYRILAGCQYDRAGAVVVFGRLTCGYGSAGQRLAGDMPRLADLEAVEAAVRETIADRQDRTLILGDAPAYATEREFSAPLCRHCATVCYGDCGAR